MRPYHADFRRFACGDGGAVDNRTAQTVISRGILAVDQSRAAGVVGRAAESGERRAGRKMSPLRGWSISVCHFPFLADAVEFADDCARGDVELGGDLFIGVAF